MHTDKHELFFSRHWSIYAIRIWKSRTFHSRSNRDEGKRTGNKKYRLIGNHEPLSNTDDQHGLLRMKRTLGLRSRTPAARSWCKGPMGLCACVSGPLYRLTERKVGRTTGNPLSTSSFFFAGCSLRACVYAHLCVYAYTSIYLYLWVYLLRWQHLARYVHLMVDRGTREVWKQGAFVPAYLPARKLTWMIFLTKWLNLA